MGCFIIRLLQLDGRGGQAVPDLVPFGHLQFPFNIDLITGEQGLIFVQVFSVGAGGEQCGKQQQAAHAGERERPYGKKLACRHIELLICYLPEFLYVCAP